MVDSVSHSAVGSLGNVAPRGGMCWHGRRSCSPSTASSRRQNIVTGDFSSAEKAPEVGFLLSASVKPCATSSRKVVLPVRWRNTPRFFFFYYWFIHWVLGLFGVFFKGEGLVFMSFSCTVWRFEVVKDATEIIHIITIIPEKSRCCPLKQCCQPSNLVATFRVFRPLMTFLIKSNWW